MVSNVTIGSALTDAQQTQAADAKLADDFAQFLTLLTVQLQNQDPLSPMDSAEFTNQLVAFTGVEQQINTNQKLDSLVALDLGNSFSASQNYVGQEVSYISSEFEYTGAPSNIRYSLGDNTSITNIFVYNELGEIVYEESGARTAGAHEFTWNGETNAGGFAVPGTYEIQVDALDNSENPVSTSTVVSGLVRGTESQNGQIFLLVGERAVGLSNILNTTQPTTTGAGDALTAALSYVGLNVSYLNTEINYDGSTPEDVLYTLDGNAERAKILVFNELGEQVFTQDVETEAGRHLFRWDGRDSSGQQLPAGDYQFVIDAIDNNDRRVPTSSIADGVVEGVETRNGQIFLNVDGRSVSIVNVLSADVADDGSA